MKEITPPKLMPLPQSTAAKGTLPIEQTKLNIEMTGPISGPQISASSGWPVRKKAFQKELGIQAATAQPGAVRQQYGPMSGDEVCECLKIR